MSGRPYRVGDIRHRQFQTGQRRILTRGLRPSSPTYRKKAFRALRREVFGFPYRRRRVCHRGGRAFQCRNEGVHGRIPHAGTGRAHRRGWRIPPPHHHQRVSNGVFGRFGREEDRARVRRFDRREVVSRQEQRAQQREGPRRHVTERKKESRHSGIPFRLISRELPVSCPHIVKNPSIYENPRIVCQRGALLGRGVVGFGVRLSRVRRMERRDVSGGFGRYAHRERMERHGRQRQRSRCQNGNRAFPTGRKHRYALGRLKRDRQFHAFVLGMGVRRALYAQRWIPASLHPIGRSGRNRFEHDLRRPPLSHGNGRFRPHAAGGYRRTPHTLFETLRRSPDGRSVRFVQLPHRMDVDLFRVPDGRVLRPCRGQRRSDLRRRKQFRYIPVLALDFRRIVHGMIVPLGNFRLDELPHEQVGQMRGLRKVLNFADMKNRPETVGFLFVSKLLGRLTIHHPPYSELVGARSVIRSPEHVLERHVDASSLRQSGKQPVGFAAGIGMERDVEIVSGFYFEPHGFRRVGTHEFVSAKNRQADVHYEVLVLVRKRRHVR